MGIRVTIGTFFLFIALLMVPVPVMAADLYVSPSGSDANNGSITSPFQTYQRGMRKAASGDTVYIRKGTYYPGAAEITNNNITIRNYPGEQVIIQLRDGGSEAFSCYAERPKTDIHIIGSDVEPVTLSNGVVSKKGIIIMDADKSQRIPFLMHGGCDRWEVAGIDFIDVADAFFIRKESSSRSGDNSADEWYVHDNRVYRYHRETGIQFNGNNNRIINNEIRKGTSAVSSPFGCYLLNLLGHGNTVSGNVLIGVPGSSCRGILFEWSQSDANIVENNTISDVPVGIDFQGGDNNIIRNNTITGSGKSGIAIVSYPQGTTDWPCSDFVGSSDPYPAVLVPPNDPTHPDYPYYYPYGECESYGNQIIGNKISGFTDGITFSSFVPTKGNTVITGNTITGWTRAQICNAQSNGCAALPANVITAIPSTATTQPTATMQPTATSHPTATVIPTQQPIIGDLDGDRKVSLSDFEILVGNLFLLFGKSANSTQGDVNNDGRLDGVDYVKMLLLL